VSRSRWSSRRTVRRTLRLAGAAVAGVWDDATVTGDGATVRVDGDDVLVEVPEAGRVTVHAGA
jgi:hypothetical protein